MNVTDIPAVTSPSAAQEFQVADLTNAIYTPGTLSGTVTLELARSSSATETVVVPFQAEQATADDNGMVPLSFEWSGLARSDTYETQAFYREDNNQFGGPNLIADNLRRVTRFNAVTGSSDNTYLVTIIRLRGTFDTISGKIRLQS